MLVAARRGVEARVSREGFNNVRPRLGLKNDPALPPGALDAVLMVDAYHEVEDRVTMLSNIAKSLKPQGRLGIVDFRLDGTGPGPAPEERVSPDVGRAIIDWLRQLPAK